MPRFKHPAINDTMWKFTWQAFSIHRTKRLWPLRIPFVLFVVVCQNIRHVRDYFHSLPFTAPLTHLMFPIWFLASHPNVVLNRTFIVDLTTIKISYWPIDRGLQPSQGSSLTCVLYCLLIDDLSRTTSLACLERHISIHYCLSVFLIFHCHSPTSHSLSRYSQSQS
jgi:hypothetical protein